VTQERNDKCSKGGIVYENEETSQGARDMEELDTREWVPGTCLKADYSGRRRRCKLSVY